MKPGSQSGTHLLLNPALLPLQVPVFKTYNVCFQVDMGNMSIPFTESYIYITNSLNVVVIPQYPKISRIRETLIFSMCVASSSNTIKSKKKKNNEEDFGNFLLVAPQTQHPPPLPLRKCKKVKVTRRLLYTFGGGQGSIENI